MPSTIQLQRTVTLASSFVYYAPLTLSASDPALSNADWVRQFILSPPFAWRWNRGAVSFKTTEGVTDYKVAVSDLGWIEKAVSVQVANGGLSQELDIDNNLMAESRAGQLTRISAQLDDDAGNVTFRVFPAPDDKYQVDVTYQKAAPVFVGLTDTWAPIPDYLSYVYNEGFLARALEYKNDPRAPGAMQSFTQLLLAANQGLTDAQRNLFVTDRLNLQRQTQLVSSGRG